jgi:hypothetical protein
MRQNRRTPSSLLKQPPIFCCNFTIRRSRFQRVIQACDLKACPAKGRDRNGAFVLASVWLYQVVFLSNYRAGRPAAHIKEQLDLARWRVAA